MMFCATSGENIGFFDDSILTRMVYQLLYECFYGLVHPFDIHYFFLFIHSDKLICANEYVQTSHAMCTALNVVQTSHNFGDVLLLFKAIESKQVHFTRLCSLIP